MDSKLSFKLFIDDDSIVNLLHPNFVLRSPALAGGVLEKTATWANYKKISLVFEFDDRYRIKEVELASYNEGGIFEDLKKDKTFILPLNEFILFIEKKLKYLRNDTFIELNYYFDSGFRKNWYIHKKYGKYLIYSLQLLNLDYVTLSEMVDTLKFICIKGRGGEVFTSISVNLLTIMEFEK